MIRVFLIFAVLWGLSAALVFGYRQIKRSHADVTGKIVLAGAISFAFSMFIFMTETQ